jgi:hypothetical protein
MSAAGAARRPDQERRTDRAAEITECGRMDSRKLVARKQMLSHRVLDPSHVGHSEPAS